MEDGFGWIVTFDKTCMGKNYKDLEVKESETKIEKTHCKLEVPTIETKDEEVVKNHISTTIEEKHTVSPNCQLTRDRVRREIVPPQRYNHVDIDCYVLNVAEGLQYSNQRTSGKH